MLKDADERLRYFRGSLKKVSLMESENESDTNSERTLLKFEFDLNLELSLRIARDRLDQVTAG